MNLGIKNFNHAVIQVGNDLYEYDNHGINYAEDYAKGNDGADRWKAKHPGWKQEEKFECIPGYTSTWLLENYLG